MHLCQTAAGSQYVTQGSPNCLGNDSFQSDYSPGVPGTLYSSPCKTTSGQLRYVYVAENEQCPSGTSLVFYNNLCPTGAVSSAQCTTPGTTDTGTKITGNGSTYTGTSPTGMSTGNLGLWLAGMAIIFIGYIAGLVTSIIWFFQFSKAVNAYTQGKMSTAVTFLVLWLIHLIGVALIQDAFNDVEDAAAMGYGAGIGVGQPMAPAGVAPVAGFGAGNGAFSQAAPMTPPAGQPQMGPLAGPSPMMPPAGGVPQAQAPMGPAAMTSPVPVASAPPATPAPAAPAPPAVPSNNPTPAAAPALPHPAHDTGNTRNSNNEPHAEEHSAHQPEIRRFHNGHLGASHGSEDHDSDKRNHDDDSSHHPTLP